MTCTSVAVFLEHFCSFSSLFGSRGGCDYLMSRRNPEVPMAASHSLKPANALTSVAPTSEYVRTTCAVGLAMTERLRRLCTVATRYGNQSRSRVPCRPRQLSNRGMVGGVFPRGPAFGRPALGPLGDQVPEKYPRTFAAICRSVA